ncbi:monocarboxylate transporter 13-like [Ptychodera flava]|uniref:monocarboxylate transporter 13-like n=1 Tax=Ptychodera flava TaxID=63121 RepID=UPI00396A4641
MTQLDTALVLKMTSATNDGINIDAMSDYDRGHFSGDAILGSERRRERRVITDVPDGGWGWFITFSAFLNEAFLDGLTASVGVLLPTLKDYFQEGAGKVSFIASLGFFVFHSAGPFSVWIGEYTGEKRAAMIGVLLCFAGLFISGFVVNVMMLYITISCLMYFGLTLSYLPTFTLLGKYFQKRHGLANGLATAGYGLGVMGLPPICQLLITRYGWRGTFIILSGMSANLCVAVTLLRPLPTKEKNANINTVQRKHRCFSFIRRFGFHIICIQPNTIGISLAISFLGATNGTFLTFFMQRVADIGIGGMNASLLLTVLGASSCLMRLTHGWFIDLRIVSPVSVLIGSILLWTVFLLISVFVVNYWGVMILCVGFGLTSGLYNPLPFVVYKDAVERRHLSSAYGLYLFSFGIGNLIGTAITGALYDVTGTSDITMYSAATCAFLSAAILAITNIFAKRSP